MIELRKISAGYRGEPVLRDVDLVFPAGCVTVLLGPNGCGKSTLLKTALGLLPALSGEVLYDGAPLSGMPPEQVIVGGGVRMGALHVDARQYLDGCKPVLLKKRLGLFLCAGEPAKRYGVPSLKRKNLNPANDLQINCLLGSAALAADPDSIERQGIQPWMNKRNPLKRSRTKRRSRTRSPMSPGPNGKLLRPGFF